MTFQTFFQGLHRDRNLELIEDSKSLKITLLNASYFSFYDSRSNSGSKRPKTCGYGSGSQALVHW